MCFTVAGIFLLRILLVRYRALLDCKKEHVARRQHKKNAAIRAAVVATTTPPPATATASAGTDGAGAKAASPSAAVMTASVPSTHDSTISMVEINTQFAPDNNPHPTADMAAPTSLAPVTPVTPEMPETPLAPITSDPKPASAVSTTPANVIPPTAPAVDTTSTNQSEAAQTSFVTSSSSVSP
jgi:hypothetical protein